MSRAARFWLRSPAMAKPAYQSRETDSRHCRRHQPVSSEPMRSLAVIIGPLLNSDHLPFWWIARASQSWSLERLEKTM